MLTERCCRNMDYYADPEYKDEHELVVYEEYVKAYGLILHGTKLGMHIGITYCPWCGTKLPEDLSEEWCKVIKEELGLEDVFAEEWANLPEEFKTDEWWKKRGL